MINVIEKKDCSFDITYILNRNLKKRMASECRDDHMCRDRLSYRKYENATVLKSKGWDGAKLMGGVVDCNGEYIPESSYAGIDDGCGYDITEDAKDIPSTVIFLGYFSLCWGHAITDSLKKLWFLSTDECKNLLLKGVELVYIVEWNSKLPVWYHDLFKLAGFDINNALQVKEIIRFKEVIIPDDSLIHTHTGILYSKEFDNVIKHIKANVFKSSSSPRKIYLTRTQVSDKREMGVEKDVEDFFRYKGFTIISPEKFSVKDQISMIMHCDTFAATEGSTSHNSIFCEPGTTLYVLKKSNYVNCYSSFIGELTKSKTIFIDAHHSTMAYRKLPMGGPFYTCITKELCVALKEEKYPYTRHWNKYFWYFFSVPTKWLLKKIRF